MYLCVCVFAHARACTHACVCVSTIQWKEDMNLKEGRGEVHIRDQVSEGKGYMM